MVADAATVRRTRFLGATATPLALGGIAVAIRLDPTLSWTDDALSDLGVRDRSALPELPGALMLAAWVWRLGPVPGLGSR